MHCKRRHYLIILGLFLLSVFTACGGGSGAGDIHTPNKPPSGSGILSVVYLYTSRTVAQPGAVVTVVAKALESTGRPAAGRPVAFAVTGGQLTSTQSMTDERGIATATLTSAEDGEVVVTAIVEDYQATRSIIFSSNVARKPAVTIHVDSDHDGTYDEAEDYSVSQNEEIDFMVNVLNNLGFPESGVQITVSGSQITMGSAYTNETGYAHVYTTVQASNTSYERVFTVVVTASDDEGNTIRKYLTFTLEAVVPEQISVSADPDILNTGGQSTITATVIGSNGTPLHGAEVNFTASDGQIAEHATTDANGQAVVIFTAPDSVSSCGCNGEITITASVNGLSDEISLTVYGSLEVTPPVISVDGATGGTGTFTVSGGVPPYRITPSNPDYLPDLFVLDRSGDSFDVVVQAGSRTAEADFSITDSTGTSVTATLYVRGSDNAGTLAVTPSSASVYAYTNPDTSDNDNLTFVISGGLAPYSMVSSREGIIASQTNITGNVFSVDPDYPGIQTTVTLMVMDSSGQVAEVTVDVQ